MSGCPKAANPGKGPPNATAAALAAVAARGGAKKVGQNDLHWRVAAAETPAATQTRVP